MDEHLKKAYSTKYHGSQYHHDFSLIHDNDHPTWRNAPVLDAMMALLEPPEYILYLGDRSQAEARLAPYKPSLIMTQRQFRNEELGSKYNKCKGHIDCNNKYRFKLGKYTIK